MSRWMSHFNSLLVDHFKEYVIGKGLVQGGPLPVLSVTKSSGLFCTQNTNGSIASNKNHGLGFTL